MCTITNPLVLPLSHLPFQMSCILSKNEFWFHVIPCLVTVKPYIVRLSDIWMRLPLAALQAKVACHLKYLGSS